MQHNEADHCGHSRLHWGLLKFKYDSKPFLKPVHASPSSHGLLHHEAW